MQAAGLAILAAISPTALLQAALIVVIYVSLAWLPVLAFLVAPQSTPRRLSACNGWLRHNGRMILACTLVAAGLTVAADGLVGPIRKG
jgi:Sap-like sulfolipid-1-addressing protein